METERVEVGRMGAEYVVVVGVGGGGPGGGGGGGGTEVALTVVVVMAVGSSNVGADLHAICLATPFGVPIH
jgi:hypothetical protein